MPPVANPNPDRARRGASVVSTIEAKDEVVAEPLLPVGAPAAAPIVPAASASAAERNWSVYGQIQTAAKSRMAHKTADKLVYCHEAMHVQLRMQDAGWSPDVERHESDEESDDSATERDADERTAGNLSESAILRLMV